MINKAIFALLTDETITAIATGGVHRRKAPQGAGFPQIVFFIEDDEQDYHMGGESRLRKLNFDVKCRAENAEGTDQLKNAVFNKLSAFNGTVVGTQIQLITYEGSREGTENASDGSEKMVGVVQLDFEVTFFESGS